MREILDSLMYKESAGYLLPGFLKPAIRYAAVFLQPVRAISFYLY